MIKNNLTPQKTPNFPPVWAIFVVDFKCHFKEKECSRDIENVHKESRALIDAEDSTLLYAATNITGSNVHC